MVYWPWEKVTPVRRLRDEYDELLDDLDDAIKTINSRVEKQQAHSRVIYDKFESYCEASGCMAKLYYEKVAESKSEYVSIMASSQEVLSTLRSQRRKAQQIKNTLNRYYKKEQREDREYSLGEIGL